MEQQMRADRVQVYRDVLEPFLLMFTPDTVWKREIENNSAYQNKSKEDFIQDKMLSVHWTTQAMHMALIGSDEVVSAFINLLSYARNTPEQGQAGSADSQELPVELMRHMAIFLREVRRSTGNEDTALRHWDMLRVVVTDLVPALETAGISPDEIKLSRTRPLKDSKLRH